MKVTSGAEFYEYRPMCSRLDFGSNEPWEPATRSSHSPHTTHHPNATEPTAAWHPIYMSISRHLDEYCAVEGITPSAEVDVEGLSSCHQFLPSPGVDVSTTDPLSRLERARAALAATL